jgi:pyruvate dehydrogenase E1 component
MVISRTFKAKDGAYVREHFFNTPELRAMVADWSDKIFGRLIGGHDPSKIFSAFQSAVNHKGQPTVILAKTIKGYGMGESGQAQNTTHQQKKMSEHDLTHFRDAYSLP